MLQVFHSFKKSFVLVLMVLVVAFVMTGFGIDLGGSRSNVTAIKIGDQEISFTDFYKERENVERRYRQMFGENFDKIFASMNLNQQIIDQMISGALIKQFSNELGLIAGRAAVQKLILASGLFQNGYDQNIYRAYLEQMGLTSTQFEAQLTEGALAEQFSNLVEDVTFASLKETESYAMQADMTYDVSYVSFEPKNYLATIADPKDEDLRSFYESQSTDYETAPAVSYQYMVFDPKDFIAQVEILPEDIELYYSEHQHDYRLPEEVKISRIQFNFGKSDTPEKMAALKDKAEEVRNKALSGSSFADLAKIHSDDFVTKTLGGDIGWVQKGNTALAREIVAAAFALKNGGISEVLSTDYGYEIIKVDDYKEESVKDLSKVKGEIEQKLRLEQAPAYASTKAHDFYDAWTKAGTALDQFALSKTVTSRVTSGLMEAGQDPENLTGLTAKVLKAPELNQQMVEMGEITVLVGIKEYEPAEVPALENVKPKVLKSWKEQEAKSKAKEAANALVTALNDGAYKTLDEAAKTLKLTVSTERGVTSAKVTAPLNDPKIQQYIFSTFTPNKPAKEAFLVGEKYLVPQVVALKAPEQSAVAGKVDGARMQENQRLGRVFLTSLINTLKANAEIEVSPNIEM